MQKTVLPGTGGRRNPQLAVRGVSADYWMNLQQRRDLYHDRKSEDKTEDSLSVKQCAPLKNSRLCQEVVSIVTFDLLFFN